MRKTTLGTDSENAATTATGPIGRRAAIKVGAATAVATTVWAEPTIRGIARRPAYAAGASTGPIDVDVTIIGFVNGSALTGLSSMPLDIDGVTIDLIPTTFTNQNNGNVLPRLELGSPNLSFVAVVDPGVAPTGNGTVLGNNPINNSGSRLRFRRTLNQPFIVVATIRCEA